MIKAFIKDIFPLQKMEKRIYSREDKLFSAKYYALAFFVPFAIILAAAYLRQLAPFGENTLMAIDAWGQYFPMLREMKRAFRSLDMSYSFTGALGFDLTAQSAYYTNSPFWYLLFLLPGELTPGQVDMMVFIRFALAGLTFSYYLSSHYGKKSYPMIFFSTAYAFSGYTLAFINQFMWMDAVVFLPLVLLGIEKLYHGKGGVMLYTASLFLTIYSNFYIAYAVCIFAVLWFFLQSVCEWKGIREWFLSAFRFGICSLVAGILNIGVLLPLLNAIGNTLASEKGFGTQFRMYHTLLEMIKMLLPFGKSSLAYEAPNIYFGIIPAGLSVFALLSGAPLKKKISYAFLLVFMFVSFNFNLLDFIWHGFHFPNQLPGRQSFLFAFLGLVIAYHGFCTLIDKGIEKKEIKKFISVFLCAFICAEISANTVYKILSDTRCVVEASVLRNSEEMETVKENYSPEKSENEFWRIELASHRYNGGQLHGYNGISHYSSTMSGDCYKFFVQLGMSVYARNVSIEYIPNPVLNSLFGVKYIVSEYATPDAVSENVGNAGHLFVQENKAVLPLFYVGEKETLDIDMSLSGHNFTNEIFKKIAGVSDVITGNGQFADRNGEGYILNTQEFLEGIDNILESECTITEFGKTQIKGKVNSSKDGVLVISLPAKDIEIEIDGQSVETLTIAGYMAGAEILQGEHEITIKLP